MANLGSGAPIFPAWASNGGALPLSFGLIHYYLLGESGENNRVDSVGSAHFDGIPTGMLSATGINGNAAKFPGSAGINTELFTADPGVRGTLSMWVNVTNVNDHGLFIFKDGLDFLTTAGPTGHLAVREGDSQWTVTTNAVVYTDSSWYHFVFTWDFSLPAVKIYVNGVLKPSTASDPITQAPAGTFLLMGSEEQGSSLPQNSLMDEVGLWSRALGPGEIAYLYNGGVGKFYPTF